jgi:acyl carrier protein
MTYDDTWTRLLAIIRETFEDDTIDLQRETTAADVLGWDSVAHVQLVIAVEEQFGIRLTTGEAAGLANVGELADFIERHLAAGT